MGHVLAAPAPQHLRVLVVDDNIDGARALALLLGMHGHETAMAYTGPDAVAAFATFHPHLAFVDIGLPGLNGYEVARRVRAEVEPAGLRPILVALTGWGSDEDKIRSRDAGFDRHLTKPVDPHEVEALLLSLSGAL